MKRETEMLGRPGTNEKPESAQEAVVRAPYEPPSLKHLGSVRKLTLSATGSNPDFHNGRHQNK
jgi:hypothetical protein